MTVFTSQKASGNIFIAKKPLFYHMDPKDEFVNFVEQHPAYYAIIKAPLILDLLTHICESARSANDLYVAFSFADNADLDEVLAMLEKVKLVQQVKGTQKRIYYATEDAKILLDKYKKAKNYITD